MVVQLKVTAALVQPAVVWVASAKTENLTAAEKAVEASSRLPKLVSNQPKTWTRRSWKQWRRWTSCPGW